MQIKKIDPFRMSTVFITVFVLMALIAGGQPKPAHEQKVPYMWDRKNDAVFENFKNIKKPELYKAFNMEQPDLFYLENFGGMMDYFEKFYGDQYDCLHIYICAFTEEGSDHVPKDSAHKLTLVFAPAQLIDSKHTQDLGYYFFPPNTPFDPVHIEPFRLDGTVFQAWHDHFARFFLPRLRPTILPSDDNREDTTTRDTRAITYCRLDIHELLDEQGYTHFTSDGKQPINITKNMIARFATFGNIRDERASRLCHSQNRRRYPKRLFVEFDFTDDQKQIVLLEDTFGFCGRGAGREQCKACTRAIHLAKPFGTDNGQLCPPSVNCPGYKPKPPENIKR